MMHKWESQEKLLTQFEADQQSLTTDFEFTDFAYKKDEFDNVPPVVPRFLLWLQHNLKPLFARAREDMKKQTTF